jgi:hypothetical protein
MDRPILRVVIDTNLLVSLCYRDAMIVLEFKLKGRPGQFRAIDEAIRVTQFIRNRCVRLWCETRGLGPADLSAYCRLLAQERAFVRKLNSMARQAAADRDHNSARVILSKGLALLGVDHTTVGHDGKSRLGRLVPLPATGDRRGQAQSQNQESRVL